MTRGYHLWRRNGRGERRLTKEPLTDNRIILDNAAPDDYFSVSAVTSEKETIEGTLHLHDFLILKARESRCPSWVSKTGAVQQMARFGEGFPADSEEIAAKEKRAAECTSVEDLASPAVAAGDTDGAVKREVMQAMAEWKAAVEGEDVDAVVAFYADGYREPDGRTVESVRVAYRSILRKYLGDALARQKDGWGVFTAWQSPVLRLFVRQWHDVKEIERRRGMRLRAVGRRRPGDGAERHVQAPAGQPRRSRSA